jgi:hypothetical protein
VKRALSWSGALALVVLGGRSIAYALAPSPLARGLAHRAGGPALPLVAAVSVGLAVALASAVVWLATIGVAERSRLARDRPPPLRLRRLPIRAVVLGTSSSLAFALLESYLHWRAGLGWHGLHCLTGPVHRDAAPILAALSILAASLAAALEHVLAWMRRTLARLAPAPRVAPARVPRLAPRAHACSPAFAGAPLARGPPSLS